MSNDQWSLSVHPDKKDYKGPTRDIDRQELVVILIAYGIEPVKVMCDDKQVYVHFIPSEIEEFEEKYLSNKPILLSISMWAAGNEYWKNLMTLWNSKKRQRQQMSS